MADQVAAREKRAAALNSVFAALLLTVMKAVVGVLTGSLGILAEAAHSALDLVAAGVTLLAIRVSGRPPDQDHTYGHGKIENLSALFEALLLLATCAWIVSEAVERLFFKTVEVEATVPAFLVMTFSMVVDYSRSRMLMRAAKKHDSQALEADALHFATDIWSSAVVLVGLVCVLLSRRLGLPWLAEADAVAALGVSAIVVWVSVQLGERTVAALVDGVPATLRGDLAEAVRVAGVIDVRRVRVRRAGADTFADVVLTVDRGTSLVESHAIANRAEEAVRAILPRSDVVVHVEPDTSHEEPWLATVKQVAVAEGLPAHDIRVIDVVGRRTLELHVEMDGRTEVEAAHARATALEEAIRSAMPWLDGIVTHLEPNEPPVAATTGEGDETITRLVTDIVLSEEFECGPHDVEISRDQGRISLAFHCTISGSTPLDQAHELTERMERAIRGRLRGLDRVTIHVEPVDSVEPAGRSNR